jgi:hypothetical protein
MSRTRIGYESHPIEFCGSTLINFKRGTEWVLIGCIFAPYSNQNGKFEMSNSANPKKKISQIVEKANVNFETGEIKNETKVTVFQVNREPDYVKLYLKDIALLNELPKGETGILFHLVTKMDYNGIVILISSTKKIIANELGISQNTVKAAVSHFVKKKIIIRVDRGLYRLNPFLIAKGDWSNIQKIRLTIEYSAQGRVITSEFSKQMEMEFAEDVIGITDETTTETHFANIIKQQMQAGEKKKNVH